MGIPKFYRWTSERYPCLSERIKEYQIPEFDNLYLDMNGIIHNCSHPNDEDVHLRIPEQQIFRDIFHYIDFLFKMIKPCKVFFMAVDGVAPRAKMNQQRGRRFRSAKLAEDQESEAIRKGEVLPSEERFDSNCITPGTEFMARLHEQLKYFVQIKVSTDPLWQRSGLVIYLSGHDVPGEGEHKIMDFIRHERSRPDYIPVRHCLYGLDADLVMLGLSTHELQFSLLREEVKFSRPKKPKKGAKRFPKQNSETSYDLTNVSIFKYDNVPVNPVPINGNNADVPTGPLVKQGQSFMNVLEKPMEEPNKSQGPGNDTNGPNDQEDPLVPSAPDDSKAKGIFRAPLPEKTTFLLLHLSLMRDYINFEFQELEKRLRDHKTIKYDLESIIDDWILMNILVGNDFVPHLPHFHIVKGALPLLYDVYTDVLPTLDGYINESGVLNLSRFERFIRRLSQFDIETFRETYDDMKYMESKTGKNIVLGEKMFEEFNFEGVENFEEEALEPMSPELRALAQRTEEEIFGETKGSSQGKLCNEIFDDSEEFFSPEDSAELRLEFHQHKRNYYISKLEKEDITPEFLESFCKEYIRAIQWVLLYYYKGVSSWGWFYPYHYAPFCSDLKNFANFLIEFDKGRPFRPFEQLLAVLPAQSKKLLPQCYQWLMTETNSPIVEYYPPKFEQDLNGKKQDWEAVVLIPFIDELRLLQVMQNEESKLSAEEIHRNSKGALNLYSYSPEETGPVKSVGDLFPMLPKGNVKIDTMDEVTYNPATLPKGIHPKTKQDTIYQGFPTLKTKPVKAVIEKADIKVFEFVTREESMVLSLEDARDKEADLPALCRKLIGKTVWVNWPHLTFAFVSAVLTPQGKFFKDRHSGKIVQDRELIGSRVEKEFASVEKSLVQRHLKCKGIKLGKLNVIVYAKMMEGRRVLCTKQGEVKFDTMWSRLEQPFALKTCMYEENITEIFYLDRQLATTYTELFHPGDDVFYLGDKMFGSMGFVVGHSDDARASIVVKFKNEGGPQQDMDLVRHFGRGNLKSNDYFSSYEAAGRCQISSYVLSRITGTVYVSIEKETRAKQRLLAKKAEALKRRLADESSPTESSSDEEYPALEMRKINVGLDLKFNKKNLEVRGYTSKRDGSWFYSRKAIDLVNDYVYQFQDFITFMTRAEKGRDAFDASEIFPENPLERINEMSEWLEDRGVRDLPRIATNTKLLDDEDIDSVWQHILSQRSSPSPSKGKKYRTTTVPPNLLFKPGLNRGCVPPIANCSFEIMDRVVCVDRGAPVPVGRRGTVVGIQTPQASEPEQIEESFKSTGAATLTTLIVLCDPGPDVFDNPADGRTSAQKKTQKGKKMSGELASLLNISDNSSSRKENKNPKSESPSKSKDLQASPVQHPKLVKLYPYQLLNTTQGPTALHESHRDARELRNFDGFQMNGHGHPRPIPKDQVKFNAVTTSRALPTVQKKLPDYRQPVQLGQHSHDLKQILQTQLLRRQAVQDATAGTSNPFMAIVNAPAKTIQPDKDKKQKSPSSSKPKSAPSKTVKVDVLQWPSQSDSNAVKPQQSTAGAASALSVADFLQKQFNAGPIQKCSQKGDKKPQESAAPPSALMKLAPFGNSTQPSTTASKMDKEPSPTKSLGQIFSDATTYRPEDKTSPGQDQAKPSTSKTQGPDIIDMLNRATLKNNVNSAGGRAGHVLAQEQNQVKRGLLGSPPVHQNRHSVPKSAAGCGAAPLMPGLIPNPPRTWLPPQTQQRQQYHQNRRNDGVNHHYSNPRYFRNYNNGSRQDYQNYQHPQQQFYGRPQPNQFIPQLHPISTDFVPTQVAVKNASRGKRANTNQAQPAAGPPSNVGGQQVSSDQLTNDATNGRGPTVSDAAARMLMRALNGAQDQKEEPVRNSRLAANFNFN